MKDYCLKQIIIFYGGRILTRSSIAAGAEFMIVSPVLQRGFVFVDELKAFVWLYSSSPN